VDEGTSPITLNATIVGLNFLYEVTLGRPELMVKMQSVRVPQRLPVILSKEEMTRLIACAAHIKHQTALSLAYGTGLRVSEVVALKVTDIDSQRMTLRVEQGKVARIVTPCSRRSCWSAFGFGGAWHAPKARCLMAAGCFQAWIPCSLLVPVN
jgi:integrase